MDGSISGQGATPELGNFAPMRGIAMRLNSITIFEENEEWIVVLIEGGEEIRRTFKNERFARNWYDGQRARLGLPLMNDA